MARRPHPEQGFRTCSGIVRLVKPFGAARVEAACLRALEIGARSYGSVKSILDAGLDGRPLTRRPKGEEAQGLLPLHANIRGARYYH